MLRRKAASPRQDRLRHTPSMTFEGLRSRWITPLLWAKGGDTNAHEDIEVFLRVLISSGRTALPALRRFLPQQFIGNNGLRI